MVLPRLIHPCDVVVEQIDTSATIYDPDSREPIQQAERKTYVTIPGQVDWYSSFREEVEPGGVVEGAIGYVLFRKKDLDDLSVMINREDRIAKMGHVDSDVYIVKLEWLGHYSDQDGPSLLKVHFTDRAPSRQTRGV